MRRQRERMVQVNAVISAALAVALCVVNVSVEASTKIVGGTPVTSVTKYPYYATPNTGLCGATLIWGDILITAAHCKDLWGGGVWLGGTKLDRSQSKFYKTKKVIVHPKFNSVSMVNDVALIQIQTFVTNVPYATLNTDSSIPVVGSYMRAIGFGALSESGSLSSILQEVDLITESFSVCANYYKTGGGINNTVMVCNRGLPTGGKDTCQGDSGGPLFLPGTASIVGLVSFGDGCARANTPAVNTRVSGVADWVKSTVCSLGAAYTAFCSIGGPVNVPSTRAPAPRTIAPIIPTRTPTRAPVPSTRAPVPSTRAPVPSTRAPLLPTVCSDVGEYCVYNSDCCSKRCSRYYWYYRCRA